MYINTKYIKNVTEQKLSFVVSKTNNIYINPEYVLHFWFIKVATFSFNDSFALHSST